MKTTITNLILVLGLLSAGELFAQAPGYMGKKLTLGYSNNFFVSPFGPTAAADDAGFNTTHCFNAEYTIKSKTNLCFSFQTFETGVRMNQEFHSTTYISSTGEYQEITSSYVPTLPMQLRTYSGGIGFKFFTSGSLAPVGKYKKLELLIMFSNLTYDRNGFRYYDPNTSKTVKTSIGTGDYNFKTFALTYTIGRQRVFFNTIVLDYGMQVGVVPVGLLATLNGAEDFVQLNGYEDVFRSDTNQRLFRYQLFNLHLGLGFLAF
jgi:hypothetical protein